MNVSGLAGRYATALFELARDSNAIDTVAASLKTVAAALDEGGDFAALVKNPLVGREAGARAVTAVAKALGLDGLTTNFLGVLAQNRRLGVLRDVVRDFGVLVSAHRGEATARVTAAHALSDDQLGQLREKLKAGLGRDVAVDLHIDPSILGGLIVQVGSKMIDSSLKTKLDTLSLAMKG
ncbi:F0F1 ATP synthase subunit delta [Pedomonas sp. V897]|uniref:F0F1 ATP synthase subunit delta n=1 Tax=Pedomonas sp. V897 TaxID=3446482 RepID=UPI003EE41F1F